MRVPTLRTMAAVPPSQPARLLFPGGGIFFWWQAGAITALSRRIDLSTAPCCGASAGALAATLAACDVDMELALERALALSIEARAFERGPFGLYGIWAGVIRTWLDELLPADAARRCDGRVELLVTELPSLRTLAVSDFADREALIDANLASVHVPFFVDGRPTASFRGVACVDGSLRALLQPLPQLTEGCRINHHDDPRMRAKYRHASDFLRLVSPAGVREMMAWGEAYVDGVDAAGGLEALREQHAQGSDSG